MRLLNFYEEDSDGSYKVGTLVKVGGHAFKITKKWKYQASFGPSYMYVAEKKDGNSFTGKYRMPSSMMDRPDSTEIFLPSLTRRKGWHHEPTRHALAAKGIKSRYFR